MRTIEKIETYLNEGSFKDETMAAYKELAKNFAKVKAQLATKANVSDSRMKRLEVSMTEIYRTIEDLMTANA